MRGHPARFAVAPGHERAAPELAQLVERRDGYVVVEKVGEAAVAAERPPGRRAALAPT